MKERRMGWRIAYLFAAFGIYMVDQVTKAWAVKTIRFGDTVTVIDGFLDLTYAKNDGTAFSMFQNGGNFGRWFFVALAAAAAVAVMVYLFRTPRSDDRMLGACALLLAGIVGNMTDRARLGYVVDLISAHFKSYHWPVFNVADMSICMGAFLLFYDMFVTGRRERRKKASEIASPKSEASTS